MTPLDPTALDAAVRAICKHVSGRDCRQPGCGCAPGSYQAAEAAIRAYLSATPDRYAAGFRDGVEKAAGRVAETYDLHGIASAIRALAPPDADLIVGRLRWETVRGGPAEKLMCGKVAFGGVSVTPSGKWWGAIDPWCDDIEWDPTQRFDTPEAARAALVEAVRREVEGGGDE